MRIGFAGLGIMGSGMAANLLAAGHELHVWNRTKAKCEPLAERGAVVAASPAELSREAAVVILMLTGEEAVDEVLFGVDGAVDELDESTVLINMTSLAPGFTTNLAGTIAATGATYADCPVLGTRGPAAEGSLVVLVGAQPDVLERIRPVLEPMAAKIVPCGPVGAGSAMKMSINLLLGTMVAGLGEAMAFGERAGLDPGSVLDVVMAGPLASGLFGYKEELLRSGTYPVAFPAKHMAKDFKYIIDTAYETGARTPVAHEMLQLYRAAVDRGLGDEDFAAVAELFK